MTDPGDNAAGSAAAAHTWRVPAAIGMAICVVVMLLPEPLIAQGGLDFSWVLAAEDAARRHLMFGRDFVFTYGPFAVLATRLFDPATYGWALASDVALSLLLVWPLRSSRRRHVLALYAAAICLGPIILDARVACACLALFLMSLSQRRVAIAVTALLIAPLALSKLSYGLAALPLLLLSDTYHLVAHRRFPVLVPTFALVALVMLQWTGHPLVLAPQLIGNDLQVVRGYGEAMQIQYGGLNPLLGAVAFFGCYVIALAWLAWRRRRGVPLAARLELVLALVGIFWTFFILFKMGYVRQDPHVFYTWQGALLATPVIAAWFDGGQRSDRIEIGGFALAAAGCLIVDLFLGFMLLRLTTEPHLTVAGYSGKVASNTLEQPGRALAWTMPQRWKKATDDQRVARRQLARRFPSSVAGRVDVIPSELSNVIASGLNYDPRPVPQSYSAYTPRLQRLDARHFADRSSAPDTLFLEIGPEIDSRLPTLATGPTLLEIARWYDAVDVDPLGLVLRHRSEPRTVALGPRATRTFQLGEWVPLPHRADSLTVVSIDFPLTLTGKLLNTAVRPPMLLIAVRDATGREDVFRFVPGMAQVALVLSPMMRNAKLTDWRGAAAMLDPSFAPGRTAEIVAFRLIGGRGGSLAYDHGTVTARLARYAPGFATKLQNSSTTPE